jgi:hypothetical protein
MKCRIKLIRHYLDKSFAQLNKNKDPELVIKLLQRYKRVSKIYNMLENKEILKKNKKR